ncbi:MAG: membrane protein insertase YidC [Terracidiphilus sp.]
MPEIRNPNLQNQGPAGGGGGGDMRSTMGFALLMIVVLFGYQYFFKPRQDQTTPANQTQTQPAQQAQQSPPLPAGTVQPAQPQVTSNSGQAPANVATITAPSETQTTIENERVRITFTNRGAQVIHWILKDFKDTSGQPLDMVQPQASARFGFPLSLFTYEPALTSQLNQALYQPSATGFKLAPSSITFHYAANGLDVVKTFHIDTGYVISVEAQVKRNGAPVRALVQWPAGLGDMEEFVPGKIRPGAIRTPSNFAWSIDGKQDSLSPAPSGFLFWTYPGVSGNATYDLPYQYAAISDLYFAAAFMPEDVNGTTLVTLHNSIDLPSDLSDPNSAKRPADVLGLAVGDQSGYTRVRLYAGPKQIDVLHFIHATGPGGGTDGPSLEPLVHYGWLGIVAKPLYLALRFLHGLMGVGAYNWGWAIIAFTAFFNMLMLPTRFYMMKSSLKMMRLQPKVDAIKRKYANLKVTDPKRADMNTEMMALYQTEGVNMYGSCLPMFIQMPLFIAYFEVLSNVIELRQAHWFWLTDLSMPDPLHILPILIIISMFVTQIITPTPGMDPMQRRMMAFMMPIFMGSFLWKYASGLALYWGTSNLINLIIQLGINQSSVGKEMHEIAAKRALKKAGGNPKTIQGRR